MSRFRITISSADRQAMLDLIHVHRVKLLGHGGGGADYVAHAVAEQKQIDRLQDAGYRVDRHEDIDCFDFVSRSIPGPGSLFRVT